MAEGQIVIANGLESVPAPNGQTGGEGRKREVWSNDERKRFDRACKDVRAHGDLLLLRCGASLCPDRTIQLVADAGAERGAVLRCGCTDRVYSRT